MKIKFKKGLEPARYEDDERDEVFRINDMLFRAFSSEVNSLVTMMGALAGNITNDDNNNNHNNNKQSSGEVGKANSHNFSNSIKRPQTGQRVPVFEGESASNLIRLRESTGHYDYEDGDDDDDDDYDDDNVNGGKRFNGRYEDDGKDIDPAQDLAEAVKSAAEAVTRAFFSEVENELDSNENQNQLPPQSHGMKVGSDITNKTISKQDEYNKVALKSSNSFKTALHADMIWPQLLASLRESSTSITQYDLQEISTVKEPGGRLRAIINYILILIGLPANYSLSRLTLFKDVSLWQYLLVNISPFQVPSDRLIKAKELLKATEPLFTTKLSISTSAIPPVSRQYQAVSSNFRSTSPSTLQRPSTAPGRSSAITNTMTHTGTNTNSNVNAATATATATATAMASPTQAGMDIVSSNNEEAVTLKMEAIAAMNSTRKSFAANSKSFRVNNSNEDNLNDITSLLKSQTHLEKWLEEGESRGPLVSAPADKLIRWIIAFDKTTTLVLELERERIERREALRAAKRAQAEARGVISGFEDMSLQVGSADMSKLERKKGKRNSRKVRMNSPLDKNKTKERGGGVIQDDSWGHRNKDGKRKHFLPNNNMNQMEHFKLRVKEKRLLKRQKEEEEKRRKEEEMKASWEKADETNRLSFTTGNKTHKASRKLSMNTRFIVAKQVLQRSPTGLSTNTGDLQQQQQQQQDGRNSLQSDSLEELQIHDILRPMGIGYGPKPPPSLSRRNTAQQHNIVIENNDDVLEFFDGKKDFSETLTKAHSQSHLHSQSQSKKDSTVKKEGPHPLTKQVSSVIRRLPFTNMNTTTNTHTHSHAKTNSSLAKSKNTASKSDLNVGEKTDLNKIMRAHSSDGFQDPVQPKKDEKRMTSVAESILEGGGRGGGGGGDEEEEEVLLGMGNVGLTATLSPRLYDMMKYEMPNEMSTNRKEVGKNDKNDNTTKEIVDVKLDDGDKGDKRDEGHGSWNGKKQERTSPEKMTISEPVSQSVDNNNDGDEYEDDFD